MSNSYLYCPGLPGKGVPIKIVGYSYGYESQIDSAQARWALSHAPWRVAMTPLRVEIQCNSEESLATVTDYIQRHQRAFLQNVNKGVMYLVWPKRMHFGGYIPEADLGTSGVFVPDGPLSFQLITFSDLLNKLKQGIYSTDDPNVVDYTTQFSSSNTSATGDNSLVSGLFTGIQVGGGSLPDSSTVGDW